MIKSLRNEREGGTEREDEAHRQWGSRQGWVEEVRGETEEATGGGQGRLLLLWAPVFAELSIALGNAGACNFKKVK